MKNAKKRVVIFGAGGTGKRVYNMVANEATVIGFVDNDTQKWGGGGMRFAESICSL